MFELDPIREIKIGNGVVNDVSNAVLARSNPHPASNSDSGPNVQIKSMIRSLTGDHWLIQDGMGALWRMDAKTYECVPTMFFHSGSITGVDVSTIIFTYTHLSNIFLSPSLLTLAPLALHITVIFFLLGVEFFECLYTCPVDHVAATTGSDGSVRLVDYNNNLNIYRIHLLLRS